MERTDIAPGEIQATGLGRRFEVRTEASRSLKEAILGRGRSGRTPFWALRDISLHVRPGESFGVVGRNGSGKSTLLNLIARIYAPSEGALTVGGRVGSLLDIGAGFHPDFTGVENAYLSGAIHGLNRSYIRSHLDEILAFAELEDFAHVPVKKYSSGMFLRLGFSVAIHVRPDVLLVDEVLAVGDEGFQQKCFRAFWDFKRSGGTLVFVSHDPGAISNLCDRAILLERGRIVQEGRAEEVLRTYHRRMTEEDQAVAEASGIEAFAGRYEIADVRATAADGTPRDRFLEGEPLTIRADVISRTSVSNARVSMTLRDLSGRVVGAEAVTGISLEPRRTESVAWVLPQSPLREGRFFVDVRLTSEKGDEELAIREAAADFSMFSETPDAGGPVRLGGTWEVSGRPIHRAKEVALRVAIVGSPRCGKTWLRRLLASLYDLTEIGFHAPSEVDWEQLPSRCALQLHWPPTESFQTQLTRHDFRVFALARHPIDVLISILHFAAHEPETARWLQGEGGDEHELRGADPCSNEFLTYALSSRAKALLSLSPAWWQLAASTRVRYEDLVNDPSAQLADLQARIPFQPARAIEDAVRFNTIEIMRASSLNNHFWQGMPELWRSLLTADAASRIGDTYRQFFAILAYDIDPDPRMTVSRARANWFALVRPPLRNVESPVPIARRSARAKR